MAGFKKDTGLKWSENLLKIARLTGGRQESESKQLGLEDAVTVLLYAHFMQSSGKGGVDCDTLETVTGATPVSACNTWFYQTQKLQV